MLSETCFSRIAEEVRNKVSKLMVLSSHTLIQKGDLFQKPNVFPPAIIMISIGNNLMEIKYIGKKKIFFETIFDKGLTPFCKTFL